MIYVIDNFKRELERQDIMTRELSEFIENYMKFDNTKNGIACEDDYDEGYDKGYDEGYSDGYKKGYDEGGINL